MNAKLANASKSKRPKTLSIDKIRLDGGTQARESLNEHTVQTYMEVLKDLPPVVVFFDGSDHWLADGFHTVEAHTRAGEKRVPVDLREGSLNDAILFGAGANGAHGLQRSHDDKLRAVTMVLLHDEGSKWSARRIAKHCHVSPDFVSRIIQGRKEAAAALKVSSNDSPPAESVAGSVKVNGQRQPLIKPKSRKSKGAKMGFGEQQARGPQVDEYGNELASSDSEPWRCAACGEMVSGEHDCLSSPDDSGTGATAPSDDPRWSGDGEQAAPDDGPLPGKPPPAPVVETPRVRVPVRVDLAEFEIAALHCVTEPDPTLHAELFDDWENTEGHGECPEADARAAVLKLGVRFE